MKNIILSGSAEEIGKQLQESYDRMCSSTQKWMEMLQYDPYPQTGLSPKEVVWRKNKARLYRYVSPSGHQHKVPILIIYALINKPYILDLTPGMSLIEHLLECGFDIFLLDWGDFDWEDRELSYGNLVNDYIARAVQKTLLTSGSDELTMLGYCMGGTMTSMYAGLYPQERIKNIVLLSAPIDFSDAGTSSLWLNSPDYDADRIVDTFQLVPKDFIDIGVKMLRPVNNYIGTYTRLWRSIDEDNPVIAWKALNKWVNDNINFPGEAYRQWIKDLYQENKLVKKQFSLQGQTVDLARITSNLLVMAGENDHLVMTAQAQAALDYMSSSDKSYYEFPVGHGGLVFGNYAKKNVYPVMSEWLKQRSN
ncbi:Alpha/Beta hydrolase fold [Syntrophomonas zehnderi OL-4]|uniref:Alpha/Beta hydrolase fold n=1 Tax=Syntrophomonas zehnderi OL-4 TaxID=690567 RepID=A0A0E4G948_9FIRM|nr:alpha/beta fold hydrolase [Syntrophomonas zehnderi]CFX05608.1 Alpha/Beta hydrolase fold [Syntrophomonas zehnderi OL-4]CFX34463.1 Alpha/Beta hydrolase fold [Syntrophomonas zehnderi OL-4]